MIQIFDFSDYKAYLRAALSERDKSQRGSRTALAQAMACQNAYVSHVLNGHNHLSLEQAEAAGRFFGHTDEDQHFFLLLVQKGRAGTAALEKYFKQQIEVILKARTSLQVRLKSEKHLDLERQTIYNSHWMYPAVHMLLMIPEFQDPGALAERLKLDVEDVRRIIRFLEDSGLVHFKGKRAEVNFSLLHLPASSPLIRQHHCTWRLHAMEHMRPDLGEELHYSGSLAISKADAAKVRAFFVDALARTRAVAKDSREEDAFVLGLDFYRL